MKIFEHSQVEYLFLGEVGLYLQLGNKSTVQMRPIHILLAEDNEGDIISTLEALKEATLSKDISVVRNGEQGIQFPNKKATIPVIMLPDPVSGKDVSESFKNHANCCISKPVTLNRFFEVVKKIEVFQTSIVHLPKDSNYVS